MTTRPWLISLVFVCAVFTGPACDSADADADASDVEVSDGGPEAGDVGPGDGAGGPLVPVAITGEVILPTNHGSQIHALLRAGLPAKLSRVRLFARFCADPACDEPIAITEAALDGQTGEYVLLTTASAAGGGFATSFEIAQAPPGPSYLQLIGDTQMSLDAGRGSCSSTADCPGDFDLLQTAATSVVPNSDGIVDTNPAPMTFPVEIAEGMVAELSERAYLGSLVVTGEGLWEPAPPDPGRLLVAAADATGARRNFMALVDLDPSPSVGDGSYVLQHDGQDFAGDVCGIVAAGDTSYVVGIAADGAHLFPVDATTGQQLGDAPVVTIPHEGPQTRSFPCRGVHVGGHLYLLQFEGAGGLDVSYPHPITHVDLATGSVTTPADGLVDYALRALVARPDGQGLIALDMSWSKDAKDQSLGTMRLIPLAIGPDGALTVPPASAMVETQTTADETCGGTGNYPAGASIVTVGSTPRLVVGHDGGVTVHDVETLQQVGSLGLEDFGRLILQIEASRDGQRVYALPMCKSATAFFELPTNGGTEQADRNLVAILDPTGSDLRVADTTVDVDGDGSADHGIDLDYHHVKQYLRGYDGGLPVPPVVFTGPQMALGDGMLFVRGTGAEIGSSSGLGQAQDVSFHDLSTGRGLVFDDYLPWFDGLSSDAGRAAVWGFDLWPGAESAVAWISYLPGR